MFDKEAIQRAIQEATNTNFRIRREHSIGGGCINTAYRLDGDDQSYFVKLNEADKLEMFEAEADGLHEMIQTETVRVPEPIAYGNAGGSSFLVLEYLKLGSGNGHSLARLGEKLAAMHQIPQRYYGWHRDNTIGSTPQINTPGNDWVSFWRDRRLGFQLNLAARNGFSGALQHDGERLMADLDVLLADHRPQPALLHGDLWGGNYAVETSGEPVIFDPAPYYGDREADLAMMELFGGFGSRFWDAYQATYALESDYSVRKILYKLYHVLNHLNLFGAGYLSQAQSMTKRLLSELHG